MGEVRLIDAKTLERRLNESILKIGERSRVPFNLGIISGLETAKIALAKCPTIAPKSHEKTHQKLYWNEIATDCICPICGYSCNDDYYLDKYCPGCGIRLYFEGREETEE